MTIQKEKIHARSVKITFPSKFSLKEAKVLVEHWKNVTWNWDIIGGQPVFLAVRRDGIISQRPKKLVEKGIVFETGAFEIPILTNPPIDQLAVQPENPRTPIPRPAPNPQQAEPDCSKQEKELEECEKELKVDEDFQTHLEEMLEWVKNQLEDSQKENKNLSANLIRTKKELEVSQKENKNLEIQVKDMKEHIDFLEERLRNITNPPINQEQIVVQVEEPRPVAEDDKNPPTVELSKDQLLALKEKIVEYKKRVFKDLGYSPEVDISSGSVRVRFRDKRFVDVGKDQYYVIHRSTTEASLKEFIDGWAEIMKPYFRK